MNIIASRKDGGQWWYCVTQGWRAVVVLRHARMASSGGIASRKDGEQWWYCVTQGWRAVVVLRHAGDVLAVLPWNTQLVSVYFTINTPHPPPSVSVNYWECRVHPCIERYVGIIRNRTNSYRKKRVNKSLYILLMHSINVN